MINKIYTEGSRIDRRIRRFKRKLNYKPDHNHNGYGWVDDGNGGRVRIHIDNTKHGPERRKGDYRGQSGASAKTITGTYNQYMSAMNEHDKKRDSLSNLSAIDGMRMVRKHPTAFKKDTQSTAKEHYGHNRIITLNRNDFNYNTKGAHRFIFGHEKGHLDVTKANNRSSQKTDYQTIPIFQQKPYLQKLAISVYNAYKSGDMKKHERLLDDYIQKYEKTYGLTDAEHYNKLRHQIINDIEKNDIRCDHAIDHEEYLADQMGVKATSKRTAKKTLDEMSKSHKAQYNGYNNSYKGIPDPVEEYKIKQDVKGLNMRKEQIDKIPQTKTGRAGLRYINNINKK